jgi:hypothetical protein
LTDTRNRLATALAAAGLRTATGGRFAAPVVLLEPAEPWIDRDTVSHRVLVRWQLSAIARAGDSGAAYDELAALIDSVDVALLTLAGVSLPTWGAPHDVTLGNVAHPTSTGIVELYSEA